MKTLLRDIIEWDVKNWSVILEFWNKSINTLDKNNKIKALELGSRNGGLSLWLALNNIETICTDLNVSIKAKELHTKYKVNNLISYDKVDITDIKFENDTFDIVIFKSVLGALKTKENQIKAINEIYRV